MRWHIVLQTAFSLLALAPNASALTCIQTFSTKAQSCAAIASSQGLEVEQLSQLNPSLNCDEGSFNGTLCVRPQAASCSKFLSRQDSSSQSCSSIATRFHTTPLMLGIWNVGLDCSNKSGAEPQKGKSPYLTLKNLRHLCVRAWPPACAKFYTVEKAGRHTCGSLAQLFKLSLETLALLNPLLLCDDGREAVAAGVGVCVSQKYSHSDFSSLNLYYVQNTLSRLQNKYSQLDGAGKGVVDALNNAYARHVETPKYETQASLIAATEDAQELNEDLALSVDDQSVEEFESLGQGKGDEAEREEYCRHASNLLTAVQKNTFPKFAKSEGLAACKECFCSSDTGGARPLNRCVSQFMGLLQSLSDSILGKNAEDRLETAAIGFDRSPEAFEADYLPDLVNEYNGGPQPDNTEREDAFWTRIMLSERVTPTEVRVSDRKLRRTLYYKRNLDNADGSALVKRFVAPVCGFHVLNNIPEMLATRAGFDVTCCFILASGALELCLEGDLSIGGVSNWRAALAKPAMALGGALLQLEAKLCLGVFNSLSLVPVVGQYLELAVQFISISTCLLAAAMQWYLLRGQLIFSATAAVVLARANIQWGFQAYKPAHIACDYSSEQICNGQKNWCYTKPGTFWFDGLDLQVSALFYWKTIYSTAPSIRENCTAAAIQQSMGSNSSQWVKRLSNLYGMRDPTEQYNQSTSTERQTQTGGPTTSNHLRATYETSSHGAGGELNTSNRNLSVSNQKFRSTSLAPHLPPTVTEAISVSESQALSSETFFTLTETVNYAETPEMEGYLIDAVRIEL